MRITSIDLYGSNQANVCTLSFQDYRRENPYNIKTAFGLDADEIVARYYSSTGLYAPKFYNLNMNKRQVVIRIELNPRVSQNETYSDLRDDIYRVISSSRSGQVRLVFKENNLEKAQLYGLVTKIEASLFSKTPEVQLTIECDDAMLKAPSSIFLNLGGVSGRVDVDDNLSTAPHGFRGEMRCFSNTPSVKITDLNNPGWSFEIVPPNGFMNNDILFVSSEHNNKQVNVHRGSNKIELADKVLGSVFPMMFPGENAFFVQDIDDWRWTHIEYFPTYWGV